MVLSAYLFPKVLLSMIVYTNYMVKPHDLSTSAYCRYIFRKFQLISISNKILFTLRITYDLDYIKHPSRILSNMQTILLPRDKLTKILVTISTHR